MCRERENKLSPVQNDWLQHPVLVNGAQAVKNTLAEEMCANGSFIPITYKCINDYNHFKYCWQLVSLFNCNFKNHNTCHASHLLTQLQRESLEHLRWKYSPIMLYKNQFGFMEISRSNPANLRQQPRHLH